MFNLFKKIKATRGAIITYNTREDIKKDTCLLYTSIIEKNKIKEADIVSMQFSLTPDLTAFNPCTALRENGFLKNVALFTSLEPNIEGSADRVIRVLVLYYSRLQPFYVYLNGAQNLRKL